MIQALKELFDTSPIELIKVRFDNEEYPTYMLCKKKDLLDEIGRLNTGANIYSDRRIREIIIVK